MIGEKMDSQEILNRLMTAYGVSSQKSLAEALAIPANNISGWLQRDSVPGNPIIKCALDTGTDLRWLVTGEFANANVERLTFKSVPSRSEQGKALIEKMLSTGGRAVLQRVMNAYGFTTQKELSEYLGISTGTISTWVRREYFPGDVVIACALDTGVSLSWLSIGKIEPVRQDIEDNMYIVLPKKSLKAGDLEDNGTWYADKEFIPNEAIRPIYLQKNTTAWIVDLGINGLSNGSWLLKINDKSDIYDVTLLPGRKIILKKESFNFECSLDEIIPVGFVLRTLILNN